MLQTERADMVTLRLPVRAPRFYPTEEPPLMFYMKRLVKSPLALDGASFLPGTLPVSARCPFNQPKGCAREPTDQRRVSSSHSSSLRCSQRGDSPVYSRSPWHIMCRRTGGFERRSSALPGRAMARTGLVGIELGRASGRRRVTRLALSVTRWVPSSAMAAFPRGPRTVQ